MILNSSDCLAGDSVIGQMIQILHAINLGRSPQNPIDLLLANIIPAILGVATNPGRKKSQDRKVSIPEF